MPTHKATPIPMDATNALGRCSSALHFMRMVHAEFASPKDPKNIWVTEKYITVGNPIRMNEVMMGVWNHWVTLNGLSTSKAELANLCRLPAKPPEEAT